MKTKTLLLVSLLFAAMMVQGKTNTIIYPMPDGEKPSPLFEMSIGKQNVPVYDAKVSSSNKVHRLGDSMLGPNYYEHAAFSYFDTDGKTTVRVHCHETVTDVKILPENLGIKPRVKDSDIFFDVLPGQKPTIEVNGDYVHSLHLFVNNIDEEPIDKNDPNVIYFGPGIHRLSHLVVGDNKTLYVAGGAIIMCDDGPNKGRASIDVIGKNIRVKGHGIIDGSLLPVHRRSIIYIKGEDITFEGVILRDPSVWAMPLYDCKNAKVDDVKIIGHRPNSDAIDICSSENVTVENCFLRAYDDLIVVKTPKGHGPASHIYARKNVLWSELAHALSLGAEMTADITDVEFADCDVIHDHGREWALRVFQCDQATISDVRFKDLRIDECRNLISLWINEFVWSSAKERGHIKNISFENIEAKNVREKHVELLGFDKDHLVEGVTLKNITIDGKPITNDDIKQNEFVKKVVVE